MLDAGVLHIRDKMDTNDVCQSRADVSQALLRLRDDSCLVDLDLECEGAHGNEVISVHGVLFAARSKYFKALLSEPWSTPSRDTRRKTSLAHLPSDVVNAIVHAVYTGYLNVTEQNMTDVLIASMELDFPLFTQCTVQFIKRCAGEHNVCRILDAAARLYHDDLVQWCSNFISTRLLSLPISAPFVESVWQMECFESCILGNKILSDVDCFVLTLGWAAYAWEHRCRNVTDILRHACLCGEELSRLCGLASCSPAVRMELQACAEPETQMPTTCTPQETCSPKGSTAWIPDSSHASQRQKNLTTDTSGGSSGSYGSAMSRIIIDKCTKCDDGQFVNACQSAVGELTSWPSARCSASPSRVHVLAQGLIAMFGVQECLDTLILQPQEHRPRHRPLPPDSADICETYDSHCAQMMSSVESSMLGDTLSGSVPNSSCLEAPDLARSGDRRLDWECDEGPDFRPLQQSAWGELGGRQRLQDSSAVRSDSQSIFVCGGRDNSWRGSTVGLLYCPARDCWSQFGAHLRDGVIFASVAAVGRSVFLFGDCTPPLSSIPSSGDAWRPLPAAPFTGGLQFSAVEAVNDKIFVAGGRSLPNKVHDGCWELDPATSGWTTLPSMNTARYSAASAVLGSQLVVSGGQDKVNVLSSVEGLDSERGWVQLPDLRGEARKYHSMQSVRRRVYCFGGKSVDSRRQTTVEALDPREGKWNVVAHMQEPRSSFGCVEVQGYVFIIGGNDAASRPMSSVACFDPLMNSWRDSSSALPVESSGLGACVLSAT